MSNQEKVREIFEKYFGRTPLKHRLEDIQGESIELVRFTDMKNLKEETGDLLCSVMQLASECDWNIDELIDDTLKKIERRGDQYMSLGRKVKVALLGGAFDPIHEGHIKLAQFVLNSSKTFDEVWLVPANKHMAGKEMAETTHRITMCEYAAKVDKRIKVFPYEIQNNLSGETYHFVTRLLDEDFAKHQYDFSMIIGLDNANTFENWVNYEHLEKMIRFIVVSRQGEKRDEKIDWYLKQPHIYMNAETFIPDVSSTDIRTYVNGGVGYEIRNSEKLNSDVLKYIEEHNLYKEKSE